MARDGRTKKGKGGPEDRESTTSDRQNRELVTSQEAARWRTDIGYQNSRRGNPADQRRKEEDKNPARS